MTHPEAAMTREQVLEEAWRWHEEQAKIYRYRSANTFVGGEHALSLMARAHDESAQHFRALASTRQEPAPAADAEEVADLTERCKEIIDWKDTGTLKGDALRNFAKRQQELGIPEYHALPVAESKTAREAMEFVIAAALRRYAGDGVTDAMVEAATDRLVRFYSPGLRSLAKDAARSILQAAARAKSGEKGEAR